VAADVDFSSCVGTSSWSSKVTTRGPRQRAVQNNANNFSPPSDKGKRSARDRRYARRSLLWPETKIGRLCKCGRVVHGDYVAVRNDGSVSGFAGLTTCGSVWICPVCNAKIMARRTLEIGSAVASAQVQGLHVAFLTMTMRHHAGQRLATLWDALSYAWHAVTAGKPWIKAKQRFGIVGYLRVAEVTVGRNGWHVHVHSLVFLDASVPDVDGLQAVMFERWKNALVRKGLSAPTMAGQDAKLLDGPADEALSEYLTKAQDQGTVTRRRSIGLELTSTQSKGVRSGFSTRTPWALLDEWFGDGDADSADLWHEFELASKGRRQLTWSRGLRQLLGIGEVEKADEEIAAEEVGSEADDLVRITKDGWRMVLRSPELIPQILNTTDRTGLAGLRALLDEHCIEYTLPEDSTDD
jgi:hypothetical protein